MRCWSIFPQSSCNKILFHQLSTFDLAGLLRNVEHFQHFCIPECLEPQSEPIGIKCTGSLPWRKGYSRELHRNSCITWWADILQTTVMLPKSISKPEKYSSQSRSIESPLFLETAGLVDPKSLNFLPTLNKRCFRCFQSAYQLKSKKKWFQALKSNRYYGILGQRS